MTKIQNKKTVEKKSIATLIGLVFITLFTISVALPSSYAADNGSDSCARGENCTEKSDLPREWNWKKADVTFDHMYRNAN